MPHHDIITVSGRITHVFAHRFVVETKRGAILADVTPHGDVTLRKGMQVTLEGEKKPSELKVHSFTSGGETIDIEEHGHHHHHHDWEWVEEPAPRRKRATLTKPAARRKTLKTAKKKRARA